MRADVLSFQSFTICRKPKVIAMLVHVSKCVEGRGLPKKPITALPIRLSQHPETCIARVQHASAVLASALRDAQTFIARVIPNRHIRSKPIGPLMPDSFRPAI